MTTLLLDSHVLHWLAAEPDRLSAPAHQQIHGAGELAVSDVTWYELAWLAEAGRIFVSAPVATWLQGLAVNVRTVPITPTIAAAAAALKEPFPRDPADRLIYATAVERGWRLVTKDERLHGYREPDPTIW